MGYYVSNMIGIRTGGVFSGDTDMEDMKARVRKIIADMEAADEGLGVYNHLSCMSPELSAGKGSYVVFAGVFNYWRFDNSSKFARRLSEEFGAEVMIMTWDEERDTVQCQIYLDGKPLFEVSENPIGQALRRIT